MQGLLENSIVSRADFITDSNTKTSCGNDYPNGKFAEAGAREAWGANAKGSAEEKSSLPKEPLKLPGNPLFNGADPDVTIANKKYWIYPTTEANSNDALFVHSSSDLKTWQTSGAILKLNDIPWIKQDGAQQHQLWAPGIFQEDGKYYLYYSVGPQNPTPSRIGVAVSDTPDGKFKDIGKPLITGGKGFEAIDPMVFKDPKSGDYYLYCGGSAGSTLHVFKLKPDLTSIEKEIPVDNPENFTEGAFMHYRNGIYYMSYSHGQWDKSNYSVCYSESDSPTGPWNYKGTILQSNEEHLGPGHHSFLQNPSTGNWYIVYHRWDQAVAKGKMPPTRSIAIDNLEYDKNGDIIPVLMTDIGVEPAPLK